MSKYEILPRDSLFSGVEQLLGVFAIRVKLAGIRHGGTDQ